MEVLTIESKTFQTLIEKVDLMAKLLVSQGKTDEQESLMDTSELCTLLGISKTTAQRMRSRYQIGYIKSGRKVYYRKSDLDNFLNGRRHEADR